MPRSHPNKMSDLAGACALLPVPLSVVEAAAAQPRLVETENPLNSTRFSRRSMMSVSLCFDITI